MSVQSSVVITLVCLFQISGIVFSNDGIDLHCNFEYDYFYKCTLYNLNITTKAAVVTSVTGSHLPRNKTNARRNADVQEIHFYNGTLFFLPTKIGTFFKNLILLKVGHMSNPLSLGYMQRSNFRTLRKLKYLWINSNNAAIDIKMQTFFDLKNLASIYVRGNNGRIILHEKTFAENKLLRVVSITDANIGALPGSLFRRNVLLYSVDFQNCSIKTINESLFERNGNLNWVDLSYNKLEHLPKNLFSKTNEQLFAISLAGNKLKTIEVDFTQLERIREVRLRNNACTGAEYKGGDCYSVILLGNITVFQNLIEENCSVSSRVPAKSTTGFLFYFSFLFLVSF